MSTPTVKKELDSGDKIVIRHDRDDEIVTHHVEPGEVAGSEQPAKEPSSSSTPSATTDSPALTKKEESDEIIALINKIYYNIGEIFGVTESGDPEKDKGKYNKSYRALSLLLHPDKNDDPRALEAFKKLSHLYTIVKSNNWKANGAEKAWKNTRRDATRAGEAEAKKERMEEEEEARRQQESRKARDMTENEAKKMAEDAAMEKERERKRLETEASRIRIEAEKKEREEAKLKQKKQGAEVYGDTRHKASLQTAKEKQAALKFNLTSDLTYEKGDGSRALLSHVRKHKESKATPKQALALLIKKPISPLNKDEILEIIKADPSLLVSKQGFTAIAELLKASAGKLDLTDLAELRTDLGKVLKFNKTPPEDSKICTEALDVIIQGKLCDVLNNGALKGSGIGIKVQSPSERGGLELEILEKKLLREQPRLGLQRHIKNIEGLGFSIATGGSRLTPTYTLSTTTGLSEISAKQKEEVGDLTAIRIALLESRAISDPHSLQCLKSGDGLSYRINLETNQNPKEFRLKIAEDLKIDPALCLIKDGKVEISMTRAGNEAMLEGVRETTEAVTSKLNQCEILHAFLIEAGIDADAVKFRKDEKGNFTCSLENSENNKAVQHLFFPNPDTEKLEMSVDSDHIEQVDHVVQNLPTKELPVTVTLPRGVVRSSITLGELGRELTGTEKYRDYVQHSRAAPAAPTPAAPAPASVPIPMPASASTPSPSPKPTSCINFIESLVEKFKTFLGVGDEDFLRPTEKAPSTAFKPTFVQRLVETVQKLIGRESNSR